VLDEVVDAPHQLADGAEGAAADCSLRDVPESAPRLPITRAPRQRFEIARNDQVGLLCVPAARAAAARTLAGGTVIIANTGRPDGPSDADTSPTGAGTDQDLSGLFRRPLKSVSIERIEAALADALGALVHREYTAKVATLDFDPKLGSALSDTMTIVLHVLLHVQKRPTSGLGTP
jgi:hypothetical protein